MKTLITLIIVMLISFNQLAAQEPVIGGPCQGCELVFVGMPTEIKAQSRIGPKNQKGEALVLSGIVYEKSGEPAEGIIVYAYQTDVNGIYPKGSTWHGNLRGWAKTNGKGQYQFKTIRPMSYPKRDTPQHIHLHVIEPGKGTYYIDDVTFEDDPLLTQKHQEKQSCRGGCGKSMPKRDKNKIWHINRDIHLGKNVSG